MSKYSFRVTVEDLDTGEKQAMEVAEGDYVLIPFAPCYRDGFQIHTQKGTHVITVKGHRPAAPARMVPATEDSGSATA